MQNKNSSLAFASLIISAFLPQDKTEIFCNMLADKEALLYVGKEDGKYKFFHILDGEFLLTEDEVFAALQMNESSDK